MASFSLILIRLSLVAVLLTASFCQLKAIGIREAVDDAVGRMLQLNLQSSLIQSLSIANDLFLDGLWPDYNDGTWPSCCKKSKFDEKEISTLLDALEQYWPSYRCGSTSTCYSGEGLFWAHEVRVLNEAGYLPSNTEKYPLGGIVSAIQNAFHATPKLDCSKDAVNELHLCFYKDFKPRDCIIERSPENDNYFSSSSCPKYVSLPVYMSSGVDDATAAIPWILENEPL
ncbi:Ribonuclease 2 [Citrus sinensis]|uniref:Ribonuclease 2 n=1 Tax=Citrus sinensis TaxID=2711 RepID=A0ACB8N7C7_CITSI|nr:Ribonuclease 2 [Citrus sinensis]